MQIISLREHPEELETFIRSFSGWWGNEALYRDCMTAALSTASPLPQWYLLRTGAGVVAGGAGLITNDFVSRMDLMPYLCALFVEERYRGQRCGGRLIEHLRHEGAALGFSHLYLITDHIGYYEKYAFEFIGMCVECGGGTTRLYQASTF